MAQSIFFKTSAALGIVGTRKAIYARESNIDPITGAVLYNATAAYQWLYKKMAYANASAGGSSLAINTGGGLGRTKNSVYTKPPKDAEDGSTSSIRFLPKPHLTSVKTSYEDQGVLIQCNITFKVYSLSQLESMKGFFKIGGKLNVNWGWEEAGGNADPKGPAGPAGNFKGDISNFSWSIDADGGAECNTSAVGPGVNFLGADKNLPAVSDGSTQLIDEIDIPVTGIMSLIRTKAAAASTAGAAINSDPNSDGIGVVEYSPAFETGPAEAVDPEPTPKPEVDPATTVKTKHFYVSFEKLIFYYGVAITLALRAAKAAGNSPTLAITEAPNCELPADASYASANPIEMIFPGKATYGTEPKGIAFSFGSFDARFTAGDFGAIMINIEWLSKLYSTTVAEKDQNGKSNFTIKDFFNSLFAAIADNSGGAIELALITNPKDTKKMLIVEQKFRPDNVTICEIPAITQNSICRSMSLSATIPSELKSAASSDGAVGGKKTPPPAPDPVKANVMALLGSQGASATNVAAAKSYLAELLNPTSMPNSDIVYPLDFSFTIDGVTGFEFGDAVTSNYMPSIYKSDGKKSAFTVTSVEQNISGNDWTTTCTTVYRGRLT